MTDPIFITYKDFNVEFGPLGADNKFTVRVLGKTPAGEEMAASEAETVQYTPDGLRLPLLKLENRKLLAPELIDLGEKLGNLLLLGKVRALFEKSLAALGQHEGLRLRLHIDPLALALSALPWEYALLRRDNQDPAPTDFLCLRPQFSITRYEIKGSKLEPLEPVARYRLAAGMASPLDYEPILDVSKDAAAIQKAVDELNGSDPFIDLELLSPLTRSKLEEKVPGAHIFHFSGHGVFEKVGVRPDGSDIKQGKLILEKDDSTLDKYENHLLANLLADNIGHPGVRLVVLGACNTASRDTGGAWSGVAPALAREVVPAVVAMQYRVGDTQAASLLKYLYQRVLSGYSIDQAISEGRRFIFSNPGGTQGDWAFYRDWGTPVLYLRSEDGVLFPALREEETLVDENGIPTLNALVRAKSVSGKLTNVVIKDFTGAGVVNATMNVIDVKNGAVVTNVEINNFGRRPHPLQPKQ